MANFFNTQATGDLRGCRGEGGDGARGWKARRTTAGPKGDRNFGRWARPGYLYLHTLRPQQTQEPVPLLIGPLADATSLLAPCEFFRRRIAPFHDDANYHIANTAAARKRTQECIKFGEGSTACATTSSR